MKDAIASAAGRRQRGDARWPSGNRKAIASGQAYSTGHGISAAQSPAGSEPGWTRRASCA